MSAPRFAAARFRSDMAEASRRTRQWQAAHSSLYGSGAGRQPGLGTPARPAPVFRWRDRVGPAAFYTAIAVGCLLWGWFPWLLGGVLLGLGLGLLMVKALRFFEALP